MFRAVSANDFFLASKFDVDNDGTLDKQEQTQLRKTMVSVLLTQYNAVPKAADQVHTALHVHCSRFHWWSTYSSTWMAIGGLSSGLCYRRRLAVQERADLLKKFTRDLDKTVQVCHGSTIRACMTWI